MSPAAKRSEYVTYEWAFAVGAKIQVIPLIYKSTPLHPRLEALQHLNFTNRDARPWEKLFEELNLSKNRYIPPSQSNQQVDIVTAKLIDDLWLQSVQKRRRAIKALGSIGGRSAVPALIKVLQNDSSPSARMEAIEAIVKIGDLSANRALIGALISDPSIIVRSAAARALGEFRSKEAVESLTQVVESWDRGQEQTKIVALDALRKIGDKSIVPRLLEAMHTIEQEVCAKIIETLGHFGDTTSVERIAKFLDSKSNIYSTVKTQHVAAKALERIGTPEALAAVEEWRKQQGNA
jgi:HEAT repeat protein